MSPDEADTALRQAIEAHAAAYDLRDEGEMLSDFAIVAHWQSIEEDGMSRYTMQYARNPTPTHIAAGMFTTAARLVLEEDRG